MRQRQRQECRPEDPSRLGESRRTLPAEPGAATPSTPRYDVVLRGGTVYDGSGGPPFVGDVAISDDAIAAVGGYTGVDGYVQKSGAGFNVVRAVEDALRE